MRVVTDDAGSRLQVDGRDFMVLGMNWDYLPDRRRTTPTSLWGQPDDVIEAALDREMSLLQGDGRQRDPHVRRASRRAGCSYIYERYGIYTVLNHPMARYGYTLDGVVAAERSTTPNPKLRAAVTAEVVALVDEFKDTPGLLMWLLGNENNYGLTWTSSEIEALPEGERDAARARATSTRSSARSSTASRRRDPRHPVAIANGDLQYIDLIAQECKGLDVFGTNVYRGISARDLFQVVKDKLGVPVMFTEFGADAWNAARDARGPGRRRRATCSAQWREIYEQSAARARRATPSAASSSSGATAGGSTARRAASTSTTPTPRGPTAGTSRTSSRARTT